MSNPHHSSTPLEIKRQPDRECSRYPLSPDESGGPEGQQERKMSVSSVDDSVPSAQETRTSKPSWKQQADGRWRSSVWGDGTERNPIMGRRNRTESDHFADFTSPSNTPIADTTPRAKADGGRSSLDLARPVTEMDVGTEPRDRHASRTEMTSRSRQTSFSRNATLVSTCAGWVERKAVFGMEVPAALADCQIGELESDLDWFRQYFVGRPHVTIVGTHQGGPVIISASADKRASDADSSILLIDRRATRVEKRKLELRSAKSLFKSILSGKVTPKDLIGYVDPELSAANIPWEMAKPAVMSDLSDALLSFEAKMVMNQYSVGVLYCSATMEGDIFTVEHPQSTRFEQFVDLLGERVPLRGFPCYPGGLDVEGESSGRRSVYTVHLGNEVMYHVSTMIPVAKRKQLVVDVPSVLIVFVDGAASLAPEVVRGDATKVMIVVQPASGSVSAAGYATEEGYNVAVILKSDSEDIIVPFPPPVPDEPIARRDLRTWLMTVVINGARAAASTAAESAVWQERRTKALNAAAAIVHC
eukprot:CAMPEP_0175810344 /NCGR_PEP_ID=MMETSP0107_2-20121207/3273_1 /TAXON_ID=195067 ORGANISM="Goniomonas pacifica, Strain CCMP1869" /NCGR_SAMPLE_ID=MMETSP0107_2 /ASSEMBLY_ACC=CAM_ASM_000203 /LENGTH=530 /DNA_ID=CAMNT_0017122093 /DNA_START=15 /DNA_END=1608 /DNA_ORIENTATION=-